MHLKKFIFIFNLLLINLLLPLTAFAQTQTTDPFAGHYELINPAQPTNNPEKVEVLELFWYGCPHCFSLEEPLAAWRAKQPEYIDFVKQPAVFNEKWAVLAKAFYTAEILNALDKIHAPLFRAIHVDNQNINNEASLKAFFVKQGVNEADFTNTFNSFAVDNKVRRANQMSIKYGITGVPAIIVNGKYRVLNDAGIEKMFETVDYLSKREYEAMQTATPAKNP